MLIIDLQEKVQKDKKRFLRRRKINISTFDRQNFKYGNKVHTILSISESLLDSEDFFKLIKMFSGKILACDDDRINSIIEPYRYDVKPYFKEAVLSSLVNLVVCDKSIDTICIKDEKIKISPKLADLVRLCKNIIIETEPTIELQRFCDECYMNYGAFVKVTSFYSNRGKGVYFNTNDIDSEGKGTIFLEGKESIIYPDPTFFLCNEQLKNLLKYKISVKTLCAAFSDFCM